jgi:competence protein ComEC
LYLITNRKEKASWKPVSFFRLIIPLVAGIVLEKYFPLEFIYLIPAFFLSVLLVIVCNALFIYRFFGAAWIAGLAIQFGVFSFGRIVMNIHEDIPVEKSSCFSKNGSNLLLLRLLTDPIPKQKSRKAVAKIIGLIKDQRCFSENEKVLVYFNKNLDAGQVSGALLLVKSKMLRPIQNIKGIDFDYIRYCHLRHIYAQLFLRENDFAVLGSEQEKTISSGLDIFRKKTLIILKNQIPRRSENGFLEALLFGYTEDLDPALMKSYADTGVIHIIAISGLHLALICQILQLVLIKRGRGHFVNWINFILMVSILWAYSLFSGASPSVIRAAAMFSLSLFARNILREPVLYNTLAASAFILLCYEPDWLWDTGFQLSYAAVLGLGLFASPLQKLFLTQNKILQALWKATSVSLAAQVLTTPLSIYYFHQFPVYFLFANLIAVPLSSGILIGGILLCLSYPIQPLANFLGWTLGLGVQSLNGIINYFSKLPGAVITKLFITLPQLFCIYFIIFCLYRFLNRKQISWLLAGLSGVIAFQFSSFFL